jgi:hypothetical protein
VAVPSHRALLAEIVTVTTVIVLEDSREKKGINAISVTLRISNQTLKNLSWRELGESQALRRVPAFGKGSLGANAA